MERRDQLPAWFSTGACTELGIAAVSLMVPEPGETETEALAKAICDGCTVEELCLGWAMKNRRSDLGVYGGKTAHERFNLGRKIGRAKHARS